MDINQTESPVIPAAPAPQVPGIMATKIPATTSFVIAAALFLMPFLDIRCNDVSLKKINGVELATGYKVDSPGKNNSLLDGFDQRDTKSVSTQDKKDSNIYAQAALIIGLAGLLLSFLNAKTAMAAAAATGALAAVALIGLMIDIKRQVSSQQAEQSKDVIISVDFTPWLYLAVLAFGAAAFFSYKRLKQTV
jgi:hypothetical protein